MSFKSRVLFLLGVVCPAVIVAIARADTNSNPPTTQQALTADQGSALIAANGKNVVVEGTVEEIEDASDNVMRISFKEAPENGFLGVVFSQKTPKVHDYFEGPDGSALVGRRIYLHGKISLYRGKPEIVITDQKQVEVTDAATTAPG